MNMVEKNQNLQKLVTSVFVPIIITILGVQTQYWLDKTDSMIVALIALLSGLWFAFHLEFKNINAKILFLFLYMISISVIIFYSILIVSCWNGRCI